MAKIFLVSHGEMSLEVLKSAEMIIGHQEDIKAIPFYSHESREQLMSKIEKELYNQKNEHYLIMVDLRGGTPFNASILLSKKYNITVVTGLNLPSLLEAITMVETIKSLEELADIIVQVGKNSIEKIKL